MNTPHVNPGKILKEARMRAALGGRPGDRVPISDFFWTGFTKKAKALWGADLDLYRKFDLDYIVIGPNMDPMIRDFEVLHREGESITVKTGFGATVRRVADIPMPHFDGFSVKSPEELPSFVIEPGDDPRRLNRAGMDQLNCLGDTLVLDGIPSWNDRVDSYYKDFPVFGTVCEAFEYVWRCIGTENALQWMLEEPELFGDFIERIGDFAVSLAKAQIAASKGRLSGMYIWGDVAYVKGMLFSPAMWRRYFAPVTRRIIQTCKDAGLMVVYHGCGNASCIYEDFIAMGLDAYNPLEVKAGLDVVELRKQFGNRLSFVGNIDVRVLETGDRDLIRKEVLYKLQAARNGGWLCQSDHSVSSSVEPESYAYMVELIREHGVFPLKV